MKFFTALVFTILPSLLYGQDFSNRDLQSLANAERSFSAMAKEKNTRDAFLYFFSDSAVSSAPGQGPRVGKKHLEQQQPNDSWLYWYPTYSDISASGDFGFNTGPWEYRQKKSDEKAVAFGEFVSIWKKDNNGEWRVAIDIGINHGPPSATASSTVTTSSHPLKTMSSKKTVDKQEIVRIENEFLSQFKSDPLKAYNGTTSDEIRLYRPGKEPVIGLNKVSEALLTSLSNLEYSFSGGDISSAGDLAYVYGKASFEVTRDGVTKKLNGSYMRFWKKEDGKNWKIVLDLVTN